MTARLGLRASAPILFLVLLLSSAAWARAEDGAEPLDEKAAAAELVGRLKDKDPSTRVQALEEAIQNQHASLTTPLIRLLSDRELGVRLGAIEALAARTEKTARKKAASALATRLKRLSRSPGDRDELRALIEGAAALGLPGPIKALLDPIHLEMDIEEVEFRIQAVGEIPHADSVEALIDFLAQGRRGGRQKHRRFAHQALRNLTGATLEEHRTAGKDADRWRAWWKDNKKTVDLAAIAAARAASEAEKETRAERRRKKKEEAKQKRKERTEKRKAEGEKRKKAPKQPPVID